MRDILSHPKPPVYNARLCVLLCACKAAFWSCWFVGLFVNAWMRSCQYLIPLYLHPQQPFLPCRYVCFCGKVPDPPFDPWITPHSCGEVCGRPIGCEHTCVLLCHPGPCPPCPRTVPDARCFCGATTETKRCGTRRFSCNKPCGRLLGCRTHRCNVQCHEGPCGPCPRTSVQKCRCGREERDRPCSAPPWQCERVCGRPHSCGEHSCERVCCPGTTPHPFLPCFLSLFRPFEVIKFTGKAA